MPQGQNILPLGPTQATPRLDKASLHHRATNPRCKATNLHLTAQPMARALLVWNQTSTHTCRTEELQVPACQTCAFFVPATQHAPCRGSICICPLCVQCAVPRVSSEELIACRPASAITRKRASPRITFWLKRAATGGPTGATIPIRAWLSCRASTGGCPTGQWVKLQCWACQRH